MIFLDEPTTGLAPEARLEVWDIIRQLASQETTVLLTTQYLDEAEQLADRIAILHRGRIIANGTLTELRRLPPASVEYVEKPPCLEDIFLALVGDIQDLFAERPVGNEVWVALAWCLGILVVAYVGAMLPYRRTLT